MTERKGFRCWRCGEALADLILPVSRREACRACAAEIHVCRMCRHFDGRRSQPCREERAEDVADRELANFCDYFDPTRDAWERRQAPADAAARGALAALFGEAPAGAAKAGRDAAHGDEAADDPDAARRAALDALFKDPG